MHLLLYAGQNHGELMYSKACEFPYAKLHFKQRDGRNYQSSDMRNWEFTIEEVTTQEDMATCKECLKNYQPC